jgi:ArsR family transcriptional regulator
MSSCSYIGGTMISYKCETLCIHQDKVKEVQENLIQSNDIEKVSKLFKAISDPTRIKILYALQFNELCVCDISIILNMSQSSISHQLKTLKDVDLVRTRKDGKTRFYRLADEHIHKLFAQVIDHVNEDNHEKDI